MSRPNWPDANRHDPGIALIELFAYVGDLLSYQQDQIAREEYLRTRRRVAFAVAAGALLLWCCRRRPT